MNPTHSKLLAECDAIEALRSAATPGPWRAWRTGNAPLKVGGCGQSELQPLERPYNPQFIGYQTPEGADELHRKVMLKDEDADFIASAHKMADLIQSLRTALSGQGEARLSQEFVDTVLNHGYNCAIKGMSLVEALNTINRKLDTAPPSPQQGTREAVAIYRFKMPPLLPNFMGWINGDMSAADEAKMRSVCPNLEVQRACLAAPTPAPQDARPVAYRTRRQAGEDYQYFDYSEVHGVEPLYTSPFSASPHGLLPEIAELVNRFANALAEKFYKSQVKYGYDKAEWQRDDWSEHCRTQLMHHITKGDPRDVAAYCAFMWHHGWSTAPQEAVEPHHWLIRSPASTPMTRSFCDIRFLKQDADDCARDNGVVAEPFYAHPPASPPSVPGFVLVPVEPTNDMLNAALINDAISVDGEGRQTRTRAGAIASYRALLSAAPQPPPAAGQWMAIESPPTDDAPLYLLVDDSRNNRLGYFAEGVWWIRGRPNGDDEPAYKTGYRITHWMPLPSPPTVTQPAGATGEVK